MHRKGCDYETGPAPAELYRAGFRFVGRYLSTPGNPKNLTHAELAELRSAGLDVVLVFETTAERALAGIDAGRADGLSAIEQVQALGLPKRTPVYFAVDFEPNEHETELVLAYLAGCSHVRGRRRTGVYGGGTLLSAARARRVVRFYWRAAATSWGPAPPLLHLQQEPSSTVLGHSVDIDYALRRRFGRIRRPASAPIYSLANAYRRWRGWRSKVAGTS